MHSSSLINPINRVSVLLLLNLIVSATGAIAESNRKYSGRIYPTITPEHVGFCEAKAKKKVNKLLLLDAGENTEFKMDLQSMLQGKFHLAIKMVLPSELDSNISELARLTDPKNSEKFLNNGLLLVNKSAFLMEEKAPGFYDPMSMNKAEIIEQVLHGTEVISNHKFDSRLVKTIKGNRAVGDKSLYFDQRVSGSEGLVWSGYNEGITSAPAPEALWTHISTLEKDWGKPHHVIHFSLVNPDTLLNGGMSLFAFYKIRAGNQVKTLVIAYNIMSLSVENPLVAMVMKWFRHLFYKNIKREVGQSIDGYRQWKNAS